MDQSFLYSDMCNTEEIQQRWNQELGDFYLGIKGVCPHDSWWKNNERLWGKENESSDYWNQLQHANDGAKTWGVVDGTHNWPLQCGCMAYEKAIWLPRQDQLQDFIYYAALEKAGPLLIPSDQYKSHFLIQRLNEFVKDGHPPAGSMEQLWLGCFMQSLFGKIWAGEWKCA